MFHMQTTILRNGSKKWNLNAIALHEENSGAQSANMHVARVVLYTARSEREILDRVL